MPRLQHLLATGMILVEAGIFAYLSESWTIAVLASVAAILNWTTAWRFSLKPSQRFVGALGLAVPFTFQWAFAPYEPEHLRVFILYPLAHAVGQYGLALQAAYIWVKQTRENWSAGLPLCGICILMMAADIQTTGWQNAVFQIAVLIFLLQTAAYYSAARFTISSAPQTHARGRMLFLTLTMVGTFAISVGGSLWLERSWSTIERLYTEWMLRENVSGGAGFSRQARLGKINNQPSAQDRLTALRVYSQEEPGYLRGAAFVRYAGSTWLNDSPHLTIPPVSPHPADLPLPADQPLYPLPGTGAPDAVAAIPKRWRSLEVWPVASLGGEAAFYPLEAEWLAFPQNTLEIDAHGIAYPSGLVPDTSSQCFMRRSPIDSDGLATLPTVEDSDGAPSPTGVNLAALMDVPANLDPRIRDLATKIFSEAPTPELKVYAASRWFKKNYHYELGMTPPADMDPLTYFLLRHPPAHCEYFATGTVILLRLGRVPCRYVTGFMTTEYNYFGGYWLARNKDAHAWVEAWLPGRGWVTVESTPAAGIPHSDHLILPGHLWDDLLLRVQMLRIQLMAGTWGGLWQAARTVISLLLTTPHGWLMLAGLIIWGIILWRRHVRFTFHRKYDPISAEFHQLLTNLDRHLEGLQFSRPPWETLSQFAERVSAHPSPTVQSAAAWYRDYCEVRYRSDSIPVEIQRLRASLPELLKQLKQVAVPQEP